MVDFIAYMAKIMGIFIIAGIGGLLLNLKDENKKKRNR